MESVKAGKLGKPSHPLSQVTLGYNIARTTEAMGDVQSAEKEYMALLKEFPRYVDCQLRLACICKKRGDIKGAEKWAREAAGASSNSADALGLLAGIHIDRRDLGSAKKCVDELLAALPAEAKGVEVYGRLALGNIHLYSIPRRPAPGWKLREGGEQPYPCHGTLPEGPREGPRQLVCC